MSIPTRKIPVIMHLNASNFYGGPEKQIVEHITRLNQKRFTGIVTSFQEGKKENEILRRAEEASVRNFAIPMSRAVDVSALLYLKDLIQEKQVDLLCTHGYKSTVMGWWAAKRVNIPILAFSRGYTAENIKIAFYEWLERRVLRRLNGIICVSEGHKQRLNTFGVTNPRTWIVHNAVSVNEKPKRNLDLRGKVLERLGLSNGDSLVVSAGRLSREKGHRFLIDAISILGAKANGTHFVFCGEGACQNELERQAQRLQVADRCRFVGFRRDLDEILCVMDFMVLPSLTEGLPNVVLEAFANRKCVVATSVGGVPEIVEGGVNGILVPPNRSDLLAKGIENLLGSPEFRENLGQAGYHKVKRNFSFEKQNRKLEEIYQFIFN